jgi:hypothetical protein
MPAISSPDAFFQTRIFSLGRSDTFLLRYILYFIRHAKSDSDLLYLIQRGAYT